MVELTGDGTLDEALAQGKLYITDRLEITEEQHDKIYALLKKMCADGKVCYFNYVCFLNYLSKETDNLNLCFGCATAMTEDAHTNAGTHLEIMLSEDIYSCIPSEV